jgi:hypothetical protein
MQTSEKFCKTFWAQAFFICFWRQISYFLGFSPDAKSSRNLGKIICCGTKTPKLFQGSKNFRKFF